MSKSPAMTANGVLSDPKESNSAAGYRPRWLPRRGRLKRGTFTLDFWLEKRLKISSVWVTIVVATLCYEKTENMAFIAFRWWTTTHFITSKLTNHLDSTTYASFTFFPRTSSTRSISCWITTDHIRWRKISFWSLGELVKFNSQYDRVIFGRSSQKTWKTGS